MSTRRSIVSAIAVVMLAACGNKAKLTSTSFAMPVGMAVAGTTTQHLFVANADEDTVQIVTIEPNVSNTNFVRGPNLYFPLRIPAGSRPTRLAASDDGRYVIVLDTATSSLTLLDADAFVKASDIAGNDVTLALTQRGATPTDMVASTVGCPSGAAPGCIARVYVALAAESLVLGVDLVVTRDADGNVIAGPSFMAARSYDIGGSPQRLAVSWDGVFLYATDGAATDVVRVTIATGVIERRDIGGYGGPVALSRDGDVLLVGRPQSRDVVVMEGASDSTWTVFDADPLFTPQPRCLTDCASGKNSASLDAGIAPPDAPLCVAPLVQDEEICVDRDTHVLRPTGAPYTAVFTDGAPALILTIGNSGGSPGLTYSCTDLDRDLNNDGQVSDEENKRNTAVSVSYGEYAMVITEGDRTIGDVYWLPLKIAPGAPLTPQIADGACGKGSLDIDARTVKNDSKVADFGPYQIGNYIAGCLPTPDRARFACVEDASGGGLVVMAGNLPILASQTSGPLLRQGSWVFSWEGVLPGLDRSNGGGQLAEDGLTFTDVGLHIQDFARARGESADGAGDGDILEIVSSPTGISSCLDAIGEERRPCSFERRIKTIQESETDPGRVTITLDAPIEPTCFLGQGRIAYRVRAGNQFLVGRQGLAPWRMRIDERFGPGGTVATDEPIMFGLRQDLLTNAPPGTSACLRYDSDGKVLPDNGQNPLLARDVRFAVIVTDAFRPYLTGRTYGSNGRPVGSAGSIPGDILLYQGGPNADGVPPNPTVYITYSGSDTLVALVPTNADDASRGVIDTQFILRN